MKLVRLARLGFATMAAAIGVLSLLPLETLPETGAWDKLEHLLAYGLLAGVGTSAFPKRPVLLITGLIFYGGTLEVLQSFVPGRHPSLADVVANTIGVVVGHLLIRYFLRFRA